MTHPFAACVASTEAIAYRRFKFEFPPSQTSFSLFKIRIFLTENPKSSKALIFKLGIRADASLSGKEDLGPLKERSKDFRVVESDGVSDGLVDEELAGLNLRSAGLLGRPLGSINTSTTYDSRTRQLESSFLARGDLWRVEASSGSSTSRNDNSSLFLVQLGPVLFVRDATLLLPVHLSKQHLLWYGYDRKNGMHSLCPAVWSKHRRWLLMSMVCLNPLACSFVDLQFPNGQFTFVSGEGLSTSAFLPLCGGLLQAQGQYPGEMRFSFSRKNKWGTRITPMIQWPDKSFTLGLSQALAWQRSGLMVRPTIQFSNPGLRAELIHSVKEELNLICGCAFTPHPSVFASISVSYYWHQCIFYHFQPLPIGLWARLSQYLEQALWPLLY
ncbi:hypothetical protein GBA52_013652 [Prunus armeniaca]|nr:hypothetical protein GBA52_013652 [Prunus armeniaca]